MADGYESGEWVAERTNGEPPPSAVDFSHLCRVLDPTESETTLWHKIVDRKTHIVLFFQVKYLSCKPRISKSVQITRGKLPGIREVLKPTVYVGQHELPASFVESIFGRTYLLSLDEISELLKVVECADLSQFEDQDGDGPDGGSGQSRSKFELDPAAQRLTAILSQPGDAFSSVRRKPTKKAGSSSDHRSSADGFGMLPQTSDGEEFLDEMSVQSEAQEEGDGDTFEVIPQLQSKQRFDYVRSKRGKSALRKISDKKRPRIGEVKLPFSKKPPADLFVLSSSFLKGGTKYWTQPGEGRIQLRPGYDVYVHQNVLEDLKTCYGPQKKKWTVYAAHLVGHLIGGYDSYYRTKKPKEGIAQVLGHDALNALSGHVTEVFSQQIGKSDILRAGNRALSGCAGRSRKVHIQETRELEDPSAENVEESEET